MKNNFFSLTILVFGSQILIGTPKSRLIDLLKESEQVSFSIGGQNTASVLDQVRELQSVVAPSSGAPVIDVLKSISGTLGNSNASIDENVQRLSSLLSDVSGGSLIDKLNNFKDQMNQEKDYLLGQIQNLNDSLAQKQNDLNQTEQQLNAANDAKASLQTQIDQIDGTITSLKNTNAALQSTIDAQARTNNDLTSTIQTLQSTIAAANASIDSLTNQKSALQTNLDAANASVTALTNQKKTLEDDKQTIQASLTTAQSNLTAANNTIQNGVASIKSDAADLPTAVTAVNTALGGTGTTYARTTNLCSKVDGVVSTPGNATLTLSNITDDNISKISLNTGSGTYEYAFTNGSKITSNALFNFVHTTDPSKVIVFKNCAEDITSFSNLKSYMQQNYPANSNLSGVLDDKINTVNTTLGGTGVTTYARANALQASLTAANNTIQNCAASIKSDAPDLTTAVTAVNTALGGNGSSSAYQLLRNLCAIIFDGIYALPNGITSFKVTQVATENSGIVSITVTDNSEGAANTVYSIDFNHINNISNGSIFTLSNSLNSITMINKSGSTIRNSSSLVLYLNSLYPLDSTLSNPSMLLAAEIQTLRNNIGGSANSLRDRIAAVDRMIIDAPTGVLAADITSLRSRIVSPLGASAEADVATVAAVIGGTGSLADQLGDPGMGGISALIKSGPVNNTNVSVSFGDFNDAQSITAQLQAFIAIFNSGSFSISILSNFYTSLSDILNALSPPN